MKKKFILIIGLLFVFTTQKTHTMEKNLKNSSQRLQQNDTITNLIKKFDQHPLNKTGNAIIKSTHHKKKDKYNCKKWVLYQSDLNTTQSEQFNPRYINSNKELEHIVIIKIKFNKTTNKIEKQKMWHSY